MALNASPGNLALISAGGPQGGNFLGLVQNTLFSGGPVRRLTTADFDVQDRSLITIRETDCILVLFYIENQESIDLARLWLVAASQVAGPIFGGINLQVETPVATAFARLRSTGGHGLHWAGLRQLPFILVYRNGWPVAFYDGPRDAATIADYALTLACQANYYEPIQVGAGVALSQNISIPNYTIYQPGANELPQDSYQFTSGQSLRGYGQIQAQPQAQIQGQPNVGFPVINSPITGPTQFNPTFATPAQNNFTNNGAVLAPTSPIRPPTFATPATR